MLFDPWLSSTDKDSSSVSAMADDKAIAAAESTATLERHVLWRYESYTYLSFPTHRTFTLWK